MDDQTNDIRKQLKEAGLSDPLIDAAWPDWWSDDALASKSARAELKFSIARKVGLSPKSLIEDQVEFTWRDDARFKSLSNETEVEKAALTSFGMSVGRLLTRATPAVGPLDVVSAIEIRRAILSNRQFVDLQSLLATCWAIGVPVIHLRVFPLDAKRMHAMVVKVGNRFAILLGRDASYPAPVAFTLAHELGHIMLNHVAAAKALIDIEDPSSRDSEDHEEDEADAFALQLLMGAAEPEITTNVDEFNSAQLADASLREGPRLGIEPGSLALCLAYRTEKWAVANAALRFIYKTESPVWQHVNTVAQNQLVRSSLDPDSISYLSEIMGGSLDV